MTYLKKTFILLVAVVLLGSCSMNKINYDKDIDFNNYKTFAFYKKGIKNLRIPTDKKKFVLKTVSEALLSKGFTKSSHPDFIINVFTDIHDRVDVYQTYYSPWHRGNYVENSKEGTIYIDIVDVQKKRVIWSGNRYINLEGNDFRKFKKAIYKLLNEFPPK